MQSTKKPEVKVRSKKQTRDDLSSTDKDERLKRNAYTVSTPRTFLQKSSTADIYAKKIPKKITTSRNNESPMKEFLSPSSSQKSKSQIKMATKTPTQRNTKRLVLTNVTVSSPVVKRRLNLEEKESPRASVEERKQSASTSKNVPKEPLPARQRTKTRTLEEDEVKILTPEVIDNNAAMQDLSRKLAAKPKAFFVDLDEKPKEMKVAVKETNKSSEDEVSYEDDFESYESDFESYHSEDHSNASTQSGEASGEDELEIKPDEEVTSKEVKDEEKMLDSGNFELRESQRSARKPVMDFILEGAEVSEATEDKKASLTDEGFQEMSSSSTVSSMRIVHTEVLDRPLFIDFTKSKENKRKRKVFERLKQRARDILSMVTLHEISYSLFEMKPIPYDLYMATFGRKNYTQTAVQTFEDGNTVEIQTDEIFNDNKWTQFPVEFSKNIIFDDDNVSKCVREDDFEGKFNFLIDPDVNNSKMAENEEYKMNPLKLFLEQKDGAGSHAFPEEMYTTKLKNKEFNVNKLRKFLKKSEGIISSILNLNAGSSETLNLVKTSKLPFSRGYLNISTKNITDEKLIYLKYTKTIGVAISETKDNLIMTFHKKQQSDTIKCVICLWDTSVARCEPLKVLKATDNVVIGRYRGNTNGIFVAGLQDGTLHLWDLSEEPSWRNDVASSVDENGTKLVEIDTSRMSQIEIDREWNLRNSHVSCEEKPLCAMQVSSYTSSAVNMHSKDSADSIVGLEFVGDTREMSQDCGQKIVGQICTLQKLGILTIWSINQEKSTTTRDIGKAFWSNIRLEKKQSVHLSDHLDTPINNSNFNLNAAKRRLSNRKQERIERRKEITRPKSAILKNLDRSNSVASPRKNLPIGRNVNEWDSVIICNHLKVLRLNKDDNYLIAMNNGEVLCCKRNLRDFKVDRLCVASDKSSITRLEVTHNNLPYYLAATESGTINMCSILEARVLLTLDCRNGPPMTVDRCQSDHKGRFVASVPAQSTAEMTASRFHSNFSVKSLTWSPTNPFCVLALLATGTFVTWELTHSDINAKNVVENAAVESTSSRSNSVALITTEGEVHIHRLSTEQDKSTKDLFRKYVALL
ncbi:uncharacterized protein [Epargyreus clarus]|uniref:uncharacterized protein n=1 Tax=Epargyreus clarus TaxID=520877 RepID=UPI003C2BA630